MHKAVLKDSSTSFGIRMYRSVPQIRPPPPFATLALVQNAGGAYTWDATIFLAITPSLPIKHDPIVICRWGVEAKREDVAVRKAERCSRR